MLCAAALAAACLRCCRVCGARCLVRLLLLLLVQMGRLGGILRGSFTQCRWVVMLALLPLYSCAVAEVGSTHSFSSRLRAAEAVMS
jgi:hypothetical protein